ncbi:hypothetical protein [Phenylobacterium deserti]|uniref:Nutrient deprivation-induced protein n=1 Tax=Phenylobacterium deserti TaxID=1914756 RepID=A0A328ARL4_9CAUL|nr:hypothetical protein [Phenylobacterium deserti]RAK57682.1 hypothetical protein DJ018_07095 [Phenylobacterium deserti]
MTNTDAGGDWGASRSAGEGQSSPREMAGAAAQTVKQEAASFAASAKEKAAGQIDQHKETATRTLGDFANAIRKAGDELSQSDQSIASRLVQQAADGLEGLSRSVSDKRPEELLDAVRDFGRRNPAAFVAGSVLVGLAVGRFLRASSEPRTSDYSPQPATFTSPDGGASDIGMASTSGLSDEFASADTSGLGATDVTAAGATAIGAPDVELGSGDAGVESLTGDLDAGSVTIEGDERGALDGDDRDRSRFGGTGV